MPFIIALCKLNAYALYRIGNDNRRLFGTFVGGVDSPAKFNNVIAVNNYGVKAEGGKLISFITSSVFPSIIQWFLSTMVIHFVKL